MATGPDGLIYAIGGNSGLNTVEAYSPAGNTWSAAPSLSVGRWYLAAATGFNGRIYAIGGLVGGSAATSAVEAYTPGDSGWTMVAPLSSPRYGLTAVTAPNGNIYAIGGYDVTGAATSTVEMYSPEINIWTPVAPLQRARAFAGAAVGSDGRIYVIGGWDDQGQALSSVEAYNPQTDTWSSVHDLPSARGDVGAAPGADGRIYVIGGRQLDPSGYPSIVLNDVEAYTPATDTWSLAAGLPQPSYYVGAATGVDGRVYAIGGADSGRGPIGTVLSYGPSVTVTFSASSNTVTLTGGNFAANAQLKAFWGPFAAGPPVALGLTDGTGTMIGTMGFPPPFPLTAGQSYQVTVVDNRSLYPVSAVFTVPGPTTPTPVPSTATPTSTPSPTAVPAVPTTGAAPQPQISPTVATAGPPPAGAQPPNVTATVAQPTRAPSTTASPLTSSPTSGAGPKATARPKASMRKVAELAARISVLPRHLFDGSTAKMAVATEPKASITIRIEIVTSEVRVSGVGPRRKRTVRTVVLSRLVIRGAADRKGHFVRTLHITYKLPTAAIATFTLTARLGKRTAVRSTRCTIERRIVRAPPVGKGKSR